MENLLVLSLLKERNVEFMMEDRYPFQAPKAAVNSVKCRLEWRVSEKERRGPYF